MQAAYVRSKKVLSCFIQVWIRSFPDIVTAEHLANMEIPPIDDTKTSIPEPENQVETDLTFPGIHLVELQKIRPVSGMSPDPRNDYGGADLLWLHRPTVPKKGEELPFLVFIRRKKKRFDFEGESRSICIPSSPCSW
jgi:hypothetical protein